MAQPHRKMKRRGTAVDQIPRPQNAEIPEDLDAPVVNVGGFEDGRTTSPRGGNGPLLYSQGMEESVTLRCSSGVGYDPKKKDKKTKKEKKEKGVLGKFKKRKSCAGEGFVVSCTVPYRPDAALLALSQTDSLPRLNKSELQKLTSSLTKNNLCLVVLEQIELNKTEMSIVSCAIPLLFERANRLDSFVDKVIDQELGNSDTVGVPFRSNALHVKVLTTYHTMVCTEYLRGLLAPLIFSANDASVSFELDPGVARSKEALEKNRSRLVMSIQTLILSLLRSLHTYPFSARDLCNAIVKKLAKENNDKEMQVSVLFGFFFQRFICPALMTPVETQVVSGSLTPSCRKMLQLMGKALLNFTNAKKFPEDGPEAHLSFINRVFDLFTENRQNIFDGLLHEDKALEIQKNAEQKETMGYGLVPVSTGKAGHHHIPTKKNTASTKMEGGENEKKMLKVGVQLGGEMRMEKMGKKKEMRGGFTLLDTPPKTIQDLRPVIGISFFDFLKHFHLKDSDSIGKLMSLPEKQWEMAPFPKEMITHIRLNLSLVPESEDLKGSSNLCSIPMEVKHFGPPASPPPSFSGSADNHQSNPIISPALIAQSKVKSAGEFQKPQGKSTMRVKKPRGRESFSRTRTWGSGLERPIVQDPIPKKKLFLIPVQQETVEWEEKAKLEVPKLEEREKQKRSKFGFPVKLVGKKEDDEKETFQNIFILGRENRKLNVTDKRVSRRQASIFYSPEKKQYMLKAEGLNHFYVHIFPSSSTASFNKKIAKMSKGDCLEMTHGDIIHLNDMWKWEVHIIEQEEQNGEGGRTRSPTIPGASTTRKSVSPPPTASSFSQSSNSSLVDSGNTTDLRSRSPVLAKSPQMMMGNRPGDNFGLEMMSIYDPESHDILFGALAQILHDRRLEIKEIVKKDDLVSLWSQVPQFENHFPANY